VNTAQAIAERAAPNAEKVRARCVASGRSSLMRLRPQAAWDFACRVTGRAQRFRWGSIDCRRGRDLLFGSLTIDEAACQAPRRGTATVLQSATERAYRELFHCIEAAGYPHLVRVWNYLPRINAIEGGIERYRQFNIARQEAFLAANRSLTGVVPGACALGSSAGSLTIGFLAARKPPRSLENPRQVSAYHYPEDYGPRSPTFARAVLLDHAPEPLLLISGTAAIVGHRSMHPGDVVAQTRETITNLEAMIAAANQALGRPQFTREALDYVVYLRSRQDLPAVAAELDAWLGGGARCLFMEADICRRELLVEIEANGGPAISGMVDGRHP